VTLHRNIDTLRTILIPFVNYRGLRGGYSDTLRKALCEGYQYFCVGPLRDFYRYYQGLFLPVTPSVAVMRFLFVFMGSEHAPRHYYIRAYVRPRRKGVPMADLAKKVRPCTPWGAPCGSV
jgi:hypothetical protein